MRVGGGMACFVLDPAHRCGLVLSLQDLGLPVGGGGGGKIGNEGRFVTGGDGYADGVGAEHAFYREGGGEKGAGVCHGDADHVLLNGGKSMITSDAKMVGI